MRRILWHILLKQIPRPLPENFIRRIREEWALAAATAGGRTNAMTVSWGGIGCLWNQPVAFLFVRPQRYTYQFTEAAEGFSLSFFGPGQFRKELSYFGTVLRPGRGQDRRHRPYAAAPQGDPLFCRGGDGPPLPEALRPRTSGRDCALSELGHQPVPGEGLSPDVCGRILTALRREDTL